MNINVTSLHTYPVKSCRGIEHIELELLRSGFKDDRRWMVVDSNGRLMSQRRIPAMALIKSSVHEDSLTLEAVNMPSITLSGACGKSEVKIHKSTCVAADMGDEVAIWLEEVLDVPCRLVTMAEGEKRPVSEKYALSSDDELHFQDDLPVHLISQASLEGLNSRLDSPVLMSRFRPNIVVDGCSAHEEDRWKVIKIGELILHAAKPCSRCIIINVDQEKGKRCDDNPLMTLATYRKQEKGVMFGQYLIPEKPGIIIEGDDVEIIE